MKNKIIHKLIFVLVFAFTLFNTANASEVIGSLSSSGSQAVGPATTGSISGTVISVATNSGNSGGSSSSRGAVLGVYTPALVSTTSENYFSSDGKAIVPRSSPIAFNANTASPTPADSNIVEASTVNPLQAEVLGASSDVGTNSWFWIILGLLLAIVILVYLYSSSNNKKIIQIRQPKL